MTDAALGALGMIFGGPYILGIPEILFFIILGAAAGLAIGLFPGLGGTVGLSLMLPFTFDMTPFTALAFAMGLVSTCNTSDTIPAVMFAVPGTAAAQATIMDGHPLAKKGQAGRALGAAYMASLLGGIFGAIILGFTMPVLQPFVLLFGSPEFLMLGLLGIAMVASLSGSTPLRGLIVGALGLVLGTVGADPYNGVIRWSFGEVYLFDGLALVPLALGLFGIPEIVDMMRRGRGISDVPEVRGGILTGVKDTLKRPFLVLRSSAIGTLSGAMPGIPGSVSDWLAYGHAYQSEKGAKETFGTGDIRGVIAPESANNAKAGGNMVPALAFGIPGSPDIALVLAIMTIHGLTPGVSMLTTNLDVSYSLVWSIAIANIFGAGVCILLGRYMARIATVPPGLLAPCVIAILCIAALQTTQHPGDLIVLLVFGLLGWWMKQNRWPRVPLLLAFVLTPIIETYYFRTVERYGMSWLGRPGVIVLAVLIAVVIVAGVRGSRRGGTVLDNA